jgi:predicted dehydrogenase
MEQIRVGLVGCGRLAERGWLPAIEAVEGVVLTALADPDPARRAIGPPSVRRFADAAALVRAADVHALVLATPAGGHLTDARVAATAGLPCLVEKPPAADLAGAVELTELDPAPWIGFNRRFDPAVASLHDRVPNTGVLEIRLRLRYRRRSWAPHEVRDDVLLDLGPHAIDLGRWLAGAEIARVRAGQLTPRRAQLELELGPGRGWVTAECANDRPWRESVEVRNEEGELGRVTAGGLLRGLVSRVRPPREHPLLASLSRELRCFAAAVRGEPSGPLATAQDGAAVMAAIEAVRASAAGGGAWKAPAVRDPLRTR